MDAIECMHSRRSIRAYRAEPLARELIEMLAWAAVQAPTPPISGNEAWAICVVEGLERLEAYGERARRYAFEHQPRERPWEWTTRPGFKVFWGAPALMIFCARRGNPEAPFDCCRAGQNLLLAAHDRGLGACWVGAPMPWLSAPATKDELAIPDGFEPAVAIILGWPNEKPAGSPRPRPPIRWS